jgi:predicted ATPase/DNA-binding SARP family transcriptional activator
LGGSIGVLLAPWKIELLGRLQATAGEHTATRFRTAKTGALLAYLAYHGRRSHAREELIELFWPETEPALGRNSLSQSLSSLRNQLEPPGTPAGAVLQADRFHVRLNPDGYTTDVAAFEAALAGARKSEGDERIRRLAEAAALYGGELLPGWYDDWTLSERERLRGEMLHACFAVADHYQQSGDWSRALDAAHRALAAAPGDPEPHTRMVRLYAAAGKAAPAVRSFAELRRLLQEEYGTAPDPNLTALIASLRSAPAPPVRTAPSAVPVREAARVTGRTSLSSGTVTFLLTALEPGEAASRQFVRIAEGGGGVVVRDPVGAVAAFGVAGEALAAAAALRRAWAKRHGAGKPLPAIVLYTGDLPPGARRHGRLESLEHAATMLRAAPEGQVLCAEATAALLRRTLPGDFELVERGEFRLGSELPPERLFEVVGPGETPQHRAPIELEPAQAGSLPLQFSGFFGRAQEIRQLGALLAPPPVDEDAAADLPRLVTLTGPGGTGKTRLALETARGLQDGYRGAVWFVPLAALTDPGGIAAAVVDTLRLPRSASLDPLEQAVQALSRQPSLLVLDNLEQIVDAEQRAAGTVRALLERVPGLRCLATSRRTLGLTGEREFPVGPLPAPRGPETPAELVLFDSVRLFVDRARAVRPDFQVTAGNAAAVAELCARLEGIPLALELAAVRCQVLTPAQILGRLGNRLDSLVDRRRQPETRHQTLRAAIDWSFRLLDPALQRFFARLSVFREGWSLEAAEAVCEDAGEAAMEPLDPLMQLRECSLILTTEDPAADDGGLRFRMLETLREYAAEALPLDDRPTVERRHASFYLEFAEEAAAQMLSARQGPALSRLEGDHENLKAALQWAVRTGDAGTALRMAAALWKYWQIRGYLREGRELLETVLKSAAGAEHPKAAEVIFAAGALAVDQGAYPEARACFEESIRRSEGAGATGLTGRARQALGMIAFEQGDYAEATRLAEEALGFCRSAGDRWGAASALNTLGVIACERGEYHQATTLHTEALALRREVGEPGGIASSLNNLGIIARRRREYEQARALHEECLAIRREHQNQRGIASSLSNLGLIAADQGELDRARALYEESLAIRRRLGDQWGVGVSLVTLGLVACEQGDLELSERLLQESLSIRTGLGDRRGTANSLNALGILHQRRRRWNEAAGHHREALCLLADLGDRPGIVDSLEGLARTAAGTRAPEQAAVLLGAASALRTHIGSSHTPGEQAAYRALVESLQACLPTGDLEQRFAVGSAMTLDEAVAVALEGG